MKFLHLSDLHIKADVDEDAAVVRMISYVLAEYPEHKIIVTGDITNDGTFFQYSRAIDILSPFAGRLYVCPGNHDYGVSGVFYSERRAHRFNSVLMSGLGNDDMFQKDQPVATVLGDDSADVLLIALDSNLKTKYPFDFACGEIGDTQLKALTSTLNEWSYRPMTKILFLHHHPFIVDDPLMLLTDSDKLQDVIYGRVDAVLFGHKHEMRQWNNMIGISSILASDDSPHAVIAKEVVVSRKGVTVNSVKLNALVADALVPATRALANS